MPAEEPTSDWWDRNNPLNASLGTSSSDGLRGATPDLTTGANETALMIDQSNMSGIRSALAADDPVSGFSPAVVASPWASGHYGGNPQAIAETSPGESDRRRREPARPARRPPFWGRPARHSRGPTESPDCQDSLIRQPTSRALSLPSGAMVRALPGEGHAHRRRARSGGLVGLYKTADAGSKIKQLGGQAAQVAPLYRGRCGMEAPHVLLGQAVGQPPRFA